MNLAPDLSLPISASTTRAPLRIALLGYRSHPFVGGQGIYLKYLSRALHALGHCVHVYSGPPYPELDAEITLIRVPSLNLYEVEKPLFALRWRHLRSWADFSEWWSKISGAFGEPYAFGRRVEKILRHSDYDIIHDNQSLSYGLLKLQARGHGVVTTLHHPIHRDRDLALAAEKKWGMRCLLRRWYGFLSMQEHVVRGLHHVVTVSQTSQRDIEHYFSRAQNQTDLIYNGVDTHLFCPAENNNEEALHLLSCSSSDLVLKGLQSLLQSLLVLREDFPALKLTLVGDLKKDGVCAQFIQKNNLEKNVLCLSRLSSEALVQAYQRASVVVCPSLYEGFGLPLVEAMACGKAIVCSDGGAQPEVIGDAGLLYKAGDVEALTQTLRNVLQDKQMRMALGKKARARALEHFSWQRVAEQFSAYYERCLNLRHANH